MKVILLRFLLIPTTTILILAAAYKLALGHAYVAQFIKSSAGAVEARMQYFGLDRSYPELVFKIAGQTFTPGLGFSPEKMGTELGITKSLLESVVVMGVAFAVAIVTAIPISLVVWHSHYRRKIYYLIQVVNLVPYPLLLITLTIVFGFSGIPTSGSVSDALRIQYDPSRADQWLPDVFCYIGSGSITLAADWLIHAVLPILAIAISVGFVLVTIFLREFESVEHHPIVKLSRAVGYASAVQVKTKLVLSLKSAIGPILQIVLMLPLGGIFTELALGRHVGLGGSLTRALLETGNLRNVTAIVLCISWLIASIDMLGTLVLQDRKSVV